MTDQHHDELNRLLLKMDRGELNDADMGRLGELIQNDSTVLERYLDHVEAESMLKDRFGGFGDAEAISRLATLPPSTTPASVSDRLSSWHDYRVIAASLIAVSCLLAIGYLIGAQTEREKVQSGTKLANQIGERPTTDPLPNSGEGNALAPSGAVLCQITHRTQAVLRIREHDSFSQVSTDDLSAGDYFVDEGNLELLYESGAKVILQSPAQFRLISGKHLFLQEGRINVHCPTPQSHGFVVETPSSLAKDLGTEFAVEVAADSVKQDEFHVFTGKVSLRPKLSPYQLRLSQGEATRLDHATSTPAGIDVDLKRFIRSLASPSQAYRELVLEHNPAIYYEMSDQGDGRTLYNAIEDQYHAKIVQSRHPHNHWAPGFNGGTSFHMDGMIGRTYAVAADYPKAPGNHLTVTAWIYAESRPCWGSIAKNWGHNDDPKSRGEFHFGLYQFSGNLEASINDQTDREVFAIESKPLPLYQWHHVALVVDERHLTLYRNGELVARSECEGMKGNPDIKTLAIGTKLGEQSMKPAVNHNSFWDGRIDHLAIIHKSLSAEEIKQLHSVGRASMDRRDSIVQNN
ncbi:FecR protein [Bremerella volcania]|uniref:FecR protein n=1 Tax=Bremerella volcania TaxID=2527984 RepID=A0A518C9D1_9BACT|nr:LamG-like jellyroll fold domain-containing protein [Bremerella volcania]QDU75836.1 FecR protein [Bremerella volcania]